MYSDCLAMEINSGRKTEQIDKQTQTQTKTQNYSKTDGTQGAKVHMYWTQKGRLFLYDLLKNNDILPMIERVES